MAPCMDDGLGTRPQTQGKIRVSSRAGEGQKLQLGRMEETLLETSQQQEVQGDGPFQKVR